MTSEQSTMILEHIPAPQLVDPIVVDSHMHTPLCKHAIGEPEEYAAVGCEHGVKTIIFTCHNPIPEGWAQEVRMGMDELDDYVAMVERAAAAWDGRIEVLLGLESDYAPGMEPWLEKLHSKADFHYILGSVHVHFPDYRALYDTGDAIALQRQYFEHLAMSAESGFFDCLAHPDLVKMIEPRTWSVTPIMDDIRRALDRIAATGVAMELNTSGVRKGIHELHPGEEMLREMKARDIPVVLGSDSHRPDRVADYFMPALMQLMKVGYRSVSAFRERKRYEIDVMLALRSLKVARHQS